DPLTVDEVKEKPVSSAWELVQRDPVGYIQLRARMYPYLFISSFDFFTGIDATYSELRAQNRMGAIALKLALLVTFSLVPLMLGFAGLYQRTWDVAAGLCALVWLYTLAIHLPLWIEYRFWLPAVPAQLVSAAVGAFWIWKRLSGTRQSAVDEVGPPAEA